MRQKMGYDEFDVTMVSNHRAQRCNPQKTWCGFSFQALHPWIHFPIIAWAKKMLSKLKTIQFVSPFSESIIWKVDYSGSVLNKKKRSKRKSFPYPEHHSHCKAFQMTLPQSVPQSGHRWQKFKKPQKNHRVPSSTWWKLKSIKCLSKPYHAKRKLPTVLELWKQWRRNSCEKDVAFAKQNSGPGEEDSSVASVVVPGCLGQSLETAPLPRNKNIKTPCSCFLTVQAMH